MKRKSLLLLSLTCCLPLLLASTAPAQDMPAAAPQENVADNALPFNADAANQNTASLFTLRDALTAALGYDPRIKAARESVKAAEAALGGTRAARLPQINLSNSYGKTFATVDGVEQGYSGHQYSANLNVSAPILTFGRQEASEKLAASQLESAKLDFQQKTSTVFDDVAQAYCGLFFTQQVYRLKLENKKLLENQLIDATKRFDREAITITELLAVRTRLNNSNVELLDAASGYLAQKQKFASLIGRTDIDNLSLASANEFLQPLPANIEDAKQLFLTSSPNIKQGEQAIIRAQTEIESSRANFFPKLDLQGGVSRSIANQEITDQQYATLNMSMVLASGGSGLLDQTRLVAQLKRARYNQIEEKNNLLDDLQNRWQNYQSYIQISNQRANNIKQYNKIYLDSLRSLSLGQSTLTQVIDVRQKLLEQYINYASAVNSRVIYGLGIANNLGFIR